MTDDRDHTTGDRGDMTAVWARSLGRNMQGALDLMEAAIRDCPDELWQANMWEVPADRYPEVHGPDGNLVTDARERHNLVQRYGQPWYVAWHGLAVFEANLTHYFVPWENWPPFEGRGPDDTTTLSTALRQPDLLGYTAYTRQRVVDTMRDLTDERAATVVRARDGQLYPQRLMGKVSHLVEHASQIRQFITSAGVTSDSLPQVIQARGGT